jgi:hypothetical protein
VVEGGGGLEMRSWLGERDVDAGSIGGFQAPLYSDLPFLLVPLLCLCHSIISHDILARELWLLETP